MAISKKEFREAKDLDMLRNKIIIDLKDLGSNLGFSSESEVKTDTGRIDLVWYYDLKRAIPGVGDKIPIVGFEVETSWRTRKHLKGDVFNLLELKPSVGIILLLKAGFNNEAKFGGNYEALKRYAINFKGLLHILVWTEKDVNELLISLSQI